MTAGSIFLFWALISLLSWGIWYFGETFVVILCAVTITLCGIIVTTIGLVMGWELIQMAVEGRWSPR